LKEDADYAYFEFVSDCGDANIYVTGRTDSIVDAESWCNGWGWAYEEVTGFPELSYTICWGYLSARRLEPGSARHRRGPRSSGPRARRRGDRAPRVLSPCCGRR